MLVSLNLLKKYLELPSKLTPEEIKLRLTGATVEVERVFPLKKKGQLTDFVFEIDNKSLTNRPDLWSHYGLARELAVIFGLRLKPLGLKLDGFKKFKPLALKIAVADKNFCPRYLAARIDNLKVEQSPSWLKESLAAVGIRPINNLVDITNYVLIELGQPLHAFDAATLSGGINVRLAKPGEKLLSLDGKERQLTPEILVIADELRPVGIAGIIGGELTGITNQTHSIILESANFNPTVIRRGSQLLELKTESSIRFEKGLHPYLAELGMKRALALIKQLQPQAKITGVKDKNFFSPRPTLIKTSSSFLKKKIGQELGRTKINQELRSLGFILKQTSKEEIELTVPWWRSTGDVSIPEDIVEEVARIYGYDNLIRKPEKVHLEKARYQLEFDLEERLKNYLCLAGGLTEVFNYPWAEEKILRRLGFKEGLIELANPPAEENRFLQPSLIPNLIKNIETNLRFFEQFRIFELARVFRAGRGEFDGEDELPRQPKQLAAVFVAEKESEMFLSVKGLVEQLLKIAGWDEFDFLQNQEVTFLEEKVSLVIRLKTKPIGYLGQLKTELCQEFGFGNKQVILFELNFDELVGQRKILGVTKYRPLPLYPAIERDLTVVLDQRVAWQELLACLTGIDPLIKQVRFLGVYHQVGEGKKSVSFRVTYQSEKRTLVKQEVEEVGKKIIEQLKAKFQVELR